MLEQLGIIITRIADFICGYPLFFLLIGGGLYLFISSGFISIKRLPASIAELRKKGASKDSEGGQISSVQALVSVVAATVGLGNIAGVAIALVVGGPGAIFWMWISAIVGMATKYHEGVLAIMYRGTDAKGNHKGGPMYIIEQAFGPKARPFAMFFAFAGLIGTLCIINANQLTEAAVATFTTPESVQNSPFLASVGSSIGFTNLEALKLMIGFGIAAIVSMVVLGGIRRIANVATVLVPTMVGAYFLMVLYIILANITKVPDVISSIFSEAFNFRAGLGAFFGVAIIGARRAALVNDAGVGTASIMHGTSKNDQPVREGLIAMLGPSIDSGLVCTLTALALLLCGDFTGGGDVKGLEIAMKAFGRAIPAGEYMLMVIVFCFAISSMFSYSFYGSRCFAYLFGDSKAKYYNYFFIASLVVFAVVPLNAAVGVCDLFYALMAIPTMITILLLSGKVREATRRYFTPKQ